MLQLSDTMGVHMSCCVCSRAAGELQEHASATSSRLSQAEAAHEHAAAELATGSCGGGRVQAVCPGRVAQGMSAACTGLSVRVSDCRSCSSPRRTNSSEIVWFEFELSSAGCAWSSPAGDRTASPAGWLRVAAGLIVLRLRSQLCSVRTRRNGLGLCSRHPNLARARRGGSWEPVSVRVVAEGDRMSCIRNHWRGRECSPEDGHNSVVLSQKNLNDDGAFIQTLN